MQGDLVTVKLMIEGYLVLQFCATHNLITANILFKHNPNQETNLVAS